MSCVLEVSLHQVKVYLSVKASGKEWITAKEIARHSGVAERTARAHALKLVNLGLFDQANVFPAHRYRLSENTDRRNKSYAICYAIRLEQAIGVFGIED